MALQRSGLCLIGMSCISIQCHCELFGVLDANDFPSSLSLDIISQHNTILEVKK